MAVGQMTFQLPKPLKAELDGQVLQDGYGSRGKSRWILEAFYALMEEDPQYSLVMAGDKLQPNDGACLFTYDDTSKKSLDQHAGRLLRSSPGLNIGVKAMLLRGSIRYRLSHPEAFFDLVAAAKRRSSPAADADASARVIHKGRFAKS
jgi:hypothetical protein